MTSDNQEIREIRELRAQVDQLNNNLQALYGYIEGRFGGSSYIFPHALGSDGSLKPERLRQAAAEVGESDAEAAGVAPLLLE